jgi:cytochrome o ubiquinol oxidase subunit 2
MYRGFPGILEQTGIMKRNYVAIAFLAITMVIAVLFALLQNYTFALFDPQGLIAIEERGLIIHAVLLMLIVVIPVFILAFTIAWHYRAGNTKAVYTPDWENSPMEELIWWAIPLEIVLVIGALTWSSTHQLDPYKPIASANAPLTIEVVALDWKWLFIYPSLGIATVNQVYLPVGTPVTFDVTADAPMNSFWIPQLGGQIYAMTGMVTQLNLLANQPGTYRGSSANYSGDGFAQMNFAANAVLPATFASWVATAKQSNQPLDKTTYHELASPGTTTPQTYTLPDNTLYNSIVMQFMRQTSVGNMDH